MRIILVYQHFMVSGVGSTKPHDLARYLARAGHRVTVICGRGYLSQGMDVPRGLVRRLRIHGFDVLCLGVDYQQRMGFVRRILSFLAFTFLAIAAVCLLPRYDVLVASSTPLTVGLVGLAGRYIRRVPFVFEARDLWPEVPYEAGYLKSKTIYRISTFFEEWFYREAAAVCTVGQGICRRLVQRGVPDGKVHFLPTGVSVEEFDIPGDVEFLRRNGLEGRFVCVYVGAHGRINGLDYLVEAARHLERDGDIVFLLIGAGSEKDRLIAEAKARGVPGSSLRFHPPVARSAIPGILKACDVMVLTFVTRPGTQYMLPNKFFDYLAAGKPMVVNLRAELTDHVLQVGCGLLADPADPADLVRAVREIRADPERAREMGRSAGESARREFDRGRLHQRWQQFLLQAARCLPGR
jgi:glycosyltransferase involved in cell wall biosynthesis